jgi:thiol-disulfide isomerase/thioredoxin
MNRLSAALVFGLTVVSCCCASIGLAQQAAAPPSASPAFTSLKDLETYYERQTSELEKRRMADLRTLLPKVSGDEADAVLRELLLLAVARDFYNEAEAPARGYLGKEGGSADLKALATFVALVARANRGEHEQSLDDLAAFLKGKATPLEAKRLDSRTVLAVGEAYLQRLLLARRYDIARRVCQLITESYPDPTVKDHFVDRLQRLDMLDKPAPPIEGNDIDGKLVRLSDHKGKVVLVDFWATWCPPCVEAFPDLAEMYAKHRERGFTILGVNVDAQGKQGAERTAALNNARRFLLESRAGWLNVANGTGRQDFAQAYGVEEIPANFLIGRDGKIVALELTGDALSQAVEQALGKADGQ